MNESEKIYDIAIIGGGISGVGLAHEATNWGFECILLEKDNLGRATSANSLRIIHGGLRYLQTLNLKRSINSIRAQDELLRTYPRLISPLPCVYPLNGKGLKARLPMLAATTLYKALHKLAVHKSVDCKLEPQDLIERRVPILKGLATSGAITWTDAILNDPEELVRVLARESESQGAILAEGCEVIEVTRSSTGLFAVHARCNGAPTRFKSRAVVNMAGPWVDQINVRVRISSQKNSRQWCRAFNVVVKKQVDERYAIGIDSARSDQKKRAFFCVPRKKGSVIGTEYLPLKEGVEECCKIDDHEVTQFLEAFNQALPNSNLQESDIESIEHGVLPVESLNKDKISLVGQEQITNTLGYVEVLSTKYTTFLLQARKALHEAAKWLPRA